MPAIYFQEKLEPEELNAIRDEFPHYDFRFECQGSDWNQVEILFGENLKENELALATRLRWIHCPGISLKHLCMDAIEKRGNISVTLTKGEDVGQIAEFVMGAILAFSKQFFRWFQAPHDPEEFWDWPLKDTMWSLDKKILLQVGLGEVGNTIVARANCFGMKSWGINLLHSPGSFHPYCHKTYSTHELHSILPVVDVIVVALPQLHYPQFLFGEKEFKLMKPDSIFIVVGSAEPVDEAALAKVGKSGKFRGVLLDAFHYPPPRKDSPLRQIPSALLTPSIANCPRKEGRMAFRIFRGNLRLFAPGKINEMRNLVQRELIQYL